MTSVNLVTVTAAQKNLSRLVRRVASGKQRVVITSFEVPQVAIIDLHDLEKIGVPKAMLDKRNQKRLEHFQKILKFQESLHRSDKLKGHDPVQVLHEIRRQRDEQLMDLH